ncbi:hypothetical protein [Allomesorhizobium camelthorni]|uniref:Lipoprotein n=1 Tax=Allomesorhizobium camelthorni TaxID=475069 RepID=A0A6G4W8X9_9HYPH|nr:hypothetical protein [Mesorhizobium camelthorni]NGO50696.1 hypothetical protein [Mesorhizobium camelthorni]
MASGFRYVVIMLAAMPASACSSLPAAIEAEVVRATLYDDIPCGTLKAERAALVRQYGDPEKQPDKRQPGDPITPTGLSVVTPDFRSAAEKERGLAWGKIVAMNSSITRRCSE